MIGAQPIAGDDAPEIVLNQNARVFFPGATLGSPIELLVDGARHRFRMIGVVQEFGPAAAYVSQAVMGSLLPGSNGFLVAFQAGAGRTGAELQAACETALRSLGARVSQGLPEEEFSTALGEHTRMLIIALLLMAVVMGCVGLVGLAASMSASIVERTRETGVLRAIGAGPGKIAAILVSEAEVTAFLSLIIAFVLSLPLTRVLGVIFGQMSFRLPVDFVISATGLGVWIAGCLLGAGLSSLGTVRTTIALPLPRALAWE